MAEQAKEIPGAVGVKVGGLVRTVLLAWAIPGAGHFHLGKRRRGLLFATLVLVSFWIGWSLNGNLYTVVGDRPLTVLATLASMGVGFPYFVLRYLVGYAGEITAPAYEYGSAFILTAGLMNLLLVLDCWDIASGQKD